MMSYLAITMYVLYVTTVLWQRCYFYQNWHEGSLRLVKWYRCMVQCCPQVLLSMVKCCMLCGDTDKSDLAKLVFLGSKLLSLVGLGSALRLLFTREHLTDRTGSGSTAMKIMKRCSGRLIVKHFGFLYYWISL